MIETAKRLHALGLALHWLKPRSKMPVENKWTTGDRKPLKELLASHRSGQNLGVRLGRASKLSCGYFLAVIDCDVKAQTKEARAEMEKALRRFIATTGAVVLSGRGNGSKHVYVRTKAPAQGKKLTSSGERVKVMMPSAPPTAAERKRLTDAELKEGWRYRDAWEISLMGEGQQVVVPPSIHPDSGKAYTFAADFDELEVGLGLPVFDAAERVAPPIVAADDPAFPDVDLFDPRFSPATVDTILGHGEKDDRSAALFGVACQMIKARFKDEEILSVLTDPETWLGQAAYDHTQSRSRIKAAHWIRRYTLLKARQAIQDELAVFVETPLPEGRGGHAEPVEDFGLGGDGGDDFDDVDVDDAPLPADWRDGIERTSERDGAKPKNTSASTLR